MRSIPLNKFKIPARRIAELLWGTGGTNAVRTNRFGVYYYSCSGHGGYVVDSRSLSDEEKREINKFTEPENLHLLVQNINGIDCVIGVNMANFSHICKQRFRFSHRYPEPDWVDLKVYLFEEDCDWSILEKLTDIRLLNNNGGKECSEEEHNQQIEKAFTWLCDYRKKNNSKEERIQK
jgi:hypothetical protein